MWTTNAGFAVTATRGFRRSGTRHVTRRLNVSVVDLLVLYTNTVFVRGTRRRLRSATVNRELIVSMRPRSTYYVTGTA